MTIDEIFDRFDTSQNGILEEDDFRPYGAEALQIFERLQSIYVRTLTCLFVSRAAFLIDTVSYIGHRPRRCNNTARISHCDGA